MNNQNKFDKEQQLNAVKTLLEQAQYPAEREAYFIEYSNLKFEKNLKAFRRFFPEIYKKYLTYVPADKFQIFPNLNGSANIMDYDCLVPMYSDDPVTQCQRQVVENISKPILGITDHSSVDQIENSADFRHIDLMCSIGKIYNEARVNLKSFDKLGASIPSIMVFGIGLGYHLPGIIKATCAGFVSFFEPNEDYFFASLFVADWDEILNTLDENGSYLYLGIGLSESEIYEQFYSRTRQISVASICHAWFYQHYPSIDVNKWISEFKTNYHQFFAGFGFFDDAIIGISHSLKNLENNLPFFNKNDFNDSFFSKMPAFILANGPSLDAEIEYIQSVKDKVLLFSCNSATTALLKHGIIPDFHVAIERTESTYHFLRDNISEHHLKQLNLLTVNVMHPLVSSLFLWSGLSLKPGEPGSQIIQLSNYVEKHEIINSISYCNPLVGNTALSFVCHLGFKNIYLFGVDNGYLDPNHHHSKSSFYYDENGVTVVQPVQIGNEFSIPGNFVPAVLTDSFLHVGNVQMGRLLESFKEHKVNCFNCSNGARIEHAYPLLSSDIILNNESNINKKSVVEHIKHTRFNTFVDAEIFEKYLAFDNFDLFCTTMISILKQPVTNRKEALFVLLESVRYLYSFKDEASHLSIYLIIEGETLYVTTILISLLYNFGDDKEIIYYFNKALDHWVDFLKFAPDYYRENYKTLRM